MRGHGHGPIPPWVRLRRGRRGLQARLLLWFIGAILLAIGASLVTAWLTTEQRTDDYPTRVVSKHVQQKVGRLWEDPPACEAYVAQLREDTGLDIRLRRDPNFFGHRGRGPSGGMVFEDGIAYIPVSRRGEVVGALEIHTGAPAPRPWRIVLAIVVALFALSFVARRIAMRLARPLEHVARVAERFGAGDLTARAGVDKFSRRWVADEVRDLGRSFDDMAERISRIVLEQRELLAAISHELRSPLGRARVALEIARDRSPDRAHDDIERQLGEVDAILGDLLASARAGLADVRKQPVDIDRWVKERVATETIGPVTVHAATGVKVDIDPALLARALHNLLANAWAHGHPKDVPLVVTVEAADEAGFIRVSVRDRGPGFSAEILPRAFDAFVTGTGAARSPGQHGIGLGLALVRRIVEAHGGRVSARNAERDADLPEAAQPGAIVGIELPVLLSA